MIETRSIYIDIEKIKQIHCLAKYLSTKLITHLLKIMLHQILSWVIIEHVYIITEISLSHFQCCKDL